jgi:hypothetical protein
MRNVWWVPTNCQVLFDDSVCLDPYMGQLRRECREHPSFQANRKIALAARCQIGVGDRHLGGVSKGWCEHCHQYRASLEAHHIVPVWATALEYVCAPLLLDESPLIRGYYPDFWNLSRHSLYEVWNAPEQLAMVCSRCHTVLEKVADKTQKAAFFEKYGPRLCFGYAQAQKRFPKLWRKA